MTTLNAKANAAYHALVAETERENPGDVWAGFEHERDAFEAGYEAAASAAPRVTDEVAFAALGAFEAARVQRGLSRLEALRAALEAALPHLTSQPVASREREAEDVTRTERVEHYCELMHDAYERGAIIHGWETNPASRHQDWADVPEANKATMRVAVAALLDAVDEEMRS